jgi:hypothetical protein
MRSDGNVNDCPDPVKPILRSSGPISSRIMNRKMSSALFMARNLA